MDCYMPEGRPRVPCDPSQVGCDEIQKRHGRQKSMSHSCPGVDNTRVKTREDFYQPGIPAKPGEHYRAFLRFARRHMGASILDLGCGFCAYSGALLKDGVRCVVCDILFDFLLSAATLVLPVVIVDSALP